MHFTVVKITLNVEHIVPCLVLLTFILNYRFGIALHDSSHEGRSKRWSKQDETCRSSGWFILTWNISQRLILIARQLLVSYCAVFSTTFDLLTDVSFLFWTSNAILGSIRGCDERFAVVRNSMSRIVLAQWGAGGLNVNLCLQELSLSPNRFRVTTECLQC